MSYPIKPLSVTKTDSGFILLDLAPCAMPTMLSSSTDEVNGDQEGEQIKYLLISEGDFRHGANIGSNASQIASHHNKAGTKITASIYCEAKIERVRRKSIRRASVLDWKGYFAVADEQNNYASEPFLWSAA